MSEADLISRILLNFGDKTPSLVVAWMLVKYVWPDVKLVLLEWLKVKQCADQRPDPVANTLASLSRDVNLLVGEVRQALMFLIKVPAVAAAQPVLPVSPMEPEPAVMIGALNASAPDSSAA